MKILLVLKYFILIALLSKELFIMYTKKNIYYLQIRLVDFKITTNLFLFNFIFRDFEFLFVKLKNYYK